MFLGGVVSVWLMASMLLQEGSGGGGEVYPKSCNNVNNVIDNISIM